MVIIPIKDRKGETFSGYIHDIQPSRIPLLPYNRGESKDYDPDIYPKGTYLNIRKDSGDEKYVKNFVSFSDDEWEEREKEEEIGVQVSERCSKEKKAQ